MKTKQSAGLLIYRLNKTGVEVFLVHPGGPFWKNKDVGAWSIPKGEFTDDEPALDAAVREFEEETGIRCSGNFTALTPIRQKSGKIIYAWALQKKIDEQAVKSNFFEMEWPPKSGIIKFFPEIDKAQWMTVAIAKEKINPAQAKLIDELLIKINYE